MGPLLPFLLLLMRLFLFLLLRGLHQGMIRLRLLGPSVGPSSTRPLRSVCQLVRGLPIPVGIAFRPLPRAAGLCLCHVGSVVGDIDKMEMATLMNLFVVGALLVFSPLMVLLVIKISKRPFLVFLWIKGSSIRLRNSDLTL